MTFSDKVVVIVTFSDKVIVIVIVIVTISILLSEQREGATVLVGKCSFRLLRLAATALAVGHET